MSHHLLRICAVDRSSYTLSNDYQHLTQSHQKSLFSRATVASSRLGRRRANSAPVTPLQHPPRRQSHGSHSLQQKLQLKHMDMASQQEIRRRPSAADRTPLTESVIAARATTTTFASPPDLSRAHHRTNGKFDQVPRSCTNLIDNDSMPPPPLRQEETSSGRQSRAASTASRRNRLSLTLPVALPNGEVSRITQSPVTTASLVTPSIPPTPSETPNGAAPAGANEFIIAIAAQERRVFELKEELTRAETELARLKKQWTSEEVYRKRSDSQRTDSSRYAASIDEDVLVATKRSIELDRRKLLLQTQQGTPPSNRKVLRGNHARTLSLLSPSKTDEGFSMHEDGKPEPISLPSIEQRAAQITNPNLAKRSSWQPRSQQQTSNVPAVPQIVEDFKFGFRAFVEDIRQITIGDEPVTGQQRPIGSPTQRGSTTNKDKSGESNSTSPTRSTRSGTNSTSDGSSTALSTATQLNKTPESKPRNGKVKHFSWTPLGFDSLDDTDWSSWDSPISTKSARWSGSTINSNGLDEIQSIPERGDEDMARPARKSPASENPLLTPSLEEILPNVVNRLSPSNLKRTANNLMDEWEKSLMAPENRGKETRV
ncbi:hypothetical protein PT974_06884 [Cladobotryum mycophilum]|uniref:DUF4048 domain-containing protein n=1 Tax=Cladobotryum mycophilum TaxID=491253 RepID=A0ABR0SMY3_9HYPO